MNIYFPQLGFNGHPPLGVNATNGQLRHTAWLTLLFQWAPTLGGECYIVRSGHADLLTDYEKFQWAPTLGGECYVAVWFHLPTGQDVHVFQWAPTLGGECYEP